MYQCLASSAEVNAIDSILTLSNKRQKAKKDRKYTHKSKTCNKIAITRKLFTADLWIRMLPTKLPWKEEMGFFLSISD